MNLDKETLEFMLESCIDDSTKVIRYLKEQEKKQKPYNLTMLIFTIISATAATIAAIASIITLIQ